MVEAYQTENEDVQNPNEISVEVDGENRTIDISEYDVECDSYGYHR